MSLQQPYTYLILFLHCHNVEYLYHNTRVIAFCCRLHASGDAVHENESVEEWQAHPQPENHSGPSEEMSQSRVAQTPTSERRRRRQSITGDHAIDESQVTGPAAAAQSAQHVERVGQRAVVAQTSDSRPRWSVCGDRAQSPTRPQTQFACRHSNTGARAKELNAGFPALMHRHRPTPTPPKRHESLLYYYHRHQSPTHDVRYSNSHNNLCMSTVKI